MVIEGHPYLQTAKHLHIKVNYFFLNLFLSFFEMPKEVSPILLLLTECHHPLANLTCCPVLLSQIIHIHMAKIGLRK